MTSICGSVSSDSICGVVNPTISGVGVYVPYIGALKDVNLGNFDLTVTDITATNISTKYFECGADTNYVEIDSNGCVVLHGKSRVKKLLNLQVSDYDSETISKAFYGVCTTWAFPSSADNSISTHFDVPLDLDRTVIPTLEVAIAAEGTGDISFSLEVYYVSVGDKITELSATYIIPLVFRYSTKQVKSVASFEFTDILSENTEIMFKLSRLGRDEADTNDSTVNILNTHFKYTADKLGENI